MLDLKKYGPDCILLDNLSRKLLAELKLLATKPDDVLHDIVEYKDDEDTKITLISRMRATKKLLDSLIERYAPTPVKPKSIKKVTVKKSAKAKADTNPDGTRRIHRRKPKAEKPVEAVSRVEQEQLTLALPLKSEAEHISGLPEVELLTGDY